NEVQQWLAGHKGELRCLAARPNGGTFVSSGYSELSSWNWTDSRPRPIVLPPNTWAVTSMAYSPDGTQLATSSWSPGKYEVLIRDGGTGRVKTQIPVSQVFWAIAFDPAENRIACAGERGSISIIDLSSGKIVQEIPIGPLVLSVEYL